MSFIVKNTTMINPLDLIAPHSCRGCGALGEVLCKRCKNNIINSHSNVQPKHYKNLPPFFAIEKRDSIIGALIHDFKYNSTRAIGIKLAEILNQTLPKVEGKVTIVPLPTIGRHIRQRGLDHTLYIAKHFTELRGNTYQVSTIIERNKNTVQVGADRATRLTQAKSAYTLSKKAQINQDATYILFDDVWTTGASMKAALKKLREAGALKIIIVVLALSQ